MRILTKKEIIEIRTWKYTILRRAIQNKCIPKRVQYTREELKSICDELEGKTIKELKKIHKKYIGYA